MNENGKMGMPWGIAFGKDGVWAVADYSNNHVCIFDGQDKLIRKFGQSGTGDGQLRHPEGIPITTYMWLIMITTGYRSLTSMVGTCCSLDIEDQTMVN